MQRYLHLLYEEQACMYRHKARGQTGALMLSPSLHGSYGTPIPSWTESVQDYSKDQGGHHYAEPLCPVCLLISQQEMNRHPYAEPTKFRILTFLDVMLICPTSEINKWTIPTMKRTR